MSERLDVVLPSDYGRMVGGGRGIVASNCDALRYGCMSRPYVPGRCRRRSPAACWPWARSTKCGWMICGHKQGRGRRRI